MRCCMPLRMRRKAIVITVVALFSGGLADGFGAGADAVSTSRAGVRTVVATAMHTAAAQVDRLRAAVGGGTVSAALDALLAERGIAAPRSVPTVSRDAIGDLATAVATARRMLHTD